MGQVSEFGKMAGGIAKDINATTLKLQKLAQREWAYCHYLGIHGARGDALDAVQSVIGVLVGKQRWGRA